MVISRKNSSYLFLFVYQTTNKQKADYQSTDPLSTHAKFGDAVFRTLGEEFVDIQIYIHTHTTALARIFMIINIGKLDGVEDKYIYIKK